jgi:hypothetical protein
VQVDGAGSNWIALASYQKMMFYTSERRTIFRYDRYDVLNDAHLDCFVRIPPTSGAKLFDLRLLPGGGLLVADTTITFKRFDGSRSVIHTYDATNGRDLKWVSVSLNPDDDSFWV